MIAMTPASTRGRNPGELGDWVRTWRKKAKLSQIQLAELVGKRQATISRWENGEDAVPSTDLKTLVAIFRAQGVEVTPPIASTTTPGPLPERKLVPLRGYIGERGQIHPANVAAGLIEAPFGVDYAHPDGHRPEGVYIAETDALSPFARGWRFFVEEGADWQEGPNGLAVVHTREFGIVFATLHHSRGPGGEVYMLSRIGQPVVMIAKPLATHKVIFIDTRGA